MMNNQWSRVFPRAFVLSLCCIASAYATGKAPLVIVAEETAQNMDANTTQVLSYTVHNNVPTEPIRINMAPNRTMLTPGSSLISWSFTTNCDYHGMPNYVPPNGGCDVSVSIRAGANAGHVQENVIINYGPTFQKISPAPIVNFTINGGGGGGNLYFSVAPTGKNMTTNSTQDLVWTLTNTTGSAIPLVPGGTNFTVASPLIAPPTFSNDCSNSVPAHGTCNISTTINSLSTPGHVSQSLYVTYNTSSRLVVDTPTNFNITGSTLPQRKFTFVNKCPYTVWFSFNGGGQINGCQSTADCDAKPNVQPGTFECNPAADAGAGICFWKNPKPADNNYALAPLIGTQTVFLTEHVYPGPAGQPFVWSGNIAGRTGCTSGGCETADCGGGTGSCAVGVSFSPPVLQSEPTFQTNVDNYDISSINGLNIPMSIEPVNATRDAFNPYTCGSSGISASQTSTGGTIGGCSWSFSPPSNAYIWVADAGSTGCSANSDCNQAAGEACGLKHSKIVANSSTLQCGKFLGYWTADEVCGINSVYSQAPYTCNASADGGTPFANMYGCNAGVYVNSCYTTANQTGCCGCQNWQEAPSSLTLPSNNQVVQQCAASGNKSSNATWVSNVLNTLIWYKAACPPNYVYPYDDKSSSYTCSNSATNNSVNYRITFCPDGHTGAPPGTVQS